MADNKDLNQNINLNYKTNADDAKANVDKLNVSVKQLTDSQVNNTKQTEKQDDGLKSFKTQLREANQELLKMSQTFGETSKEAVQAAKKVADLKDQMAFAKDLTEQFNPDQKFKALGAATNIAATGMTGITGAMGLFGDQSKDTEKMLLKVQSAMAFSQAVSGLSELGDQFKTLKTVVTASYASLTAVKSADTLATEANVVAENQGFLAKTKNVVVNGLLAGVTGVVTTAQWLWNAALYANPVVAVALAVAGLVAGLGYLAKSLMDSNAENERATKANQKLSNEVSSLDKAYDKSNKTLEENNNQTLAMAKASGKSAEEIRKLSLELANQEVQEKKLNAVKAYSIYIEASRVAGLADATDAQKDTLAKAKDFYIKQNDEYKGSIDKRNQVKRDNLVAEKQEETDANQKRLDRIRKHNEEVAQAREADAKKAIQAEKDRLKALADLEKEWFKANQDLNAKTDQEKLDLQKKRDEEKLNQVAKNQQERANLEALLNEKYATLQQEIDDKKKQADQEANDKKIADKLAFDEQYYTGIREFTDAQNELEIEQVLAHKQALLQIEQDAENAKIEKDGGTQEEVEGKKLQVQAYYDQKGQENAKQADDAILAKKKAHTEANLQLLNSAFESAKVFAGKNKKVQAGILVAENAVGLAKVVINTIQGISKAMSKGIAGLPEAIIVGVAGAASAVKMISSTSKALKDLGGGGDAGTAPSISAPTAGSAEPQVGFQTSNENQIATTIANNTNAQPVVKAIVVSQEVTDQQTADRNAVTSNSF